MTDPRAHWQRIWTEKQPDGVSWYQPDPAPSLARIDALALRRDATIVDVGGGASLLVDRLLERGFRHLAVLDVAEAALDRAALRLGPLADEVTWVVSDIRDWQPAPGLFDLWHDRAVFHFLTDPAHQRVYAQVLDRALGPDGVAIIATFAPDGPEKCSGLPVARHDAASLAAALPGFRVVKAEPEIHITPGGTNQRFNWFVLHRS